MSEDPSSSLEPLSRDWVYDGKLNLLKIRAWDEKDFFHGFHLGEPDLKSKDTASWCKLHSKSNLYLLKQVHSNLVEDVRLSSLNGELVESDGWFLDREAVEKEEGSTFGVLSADCAPIILFSQEEKCSAVLHSGWRGAASNILSEALKKFRNAKTVEMAIGPSAGSCCYEFEREIAEKYFRQWIDAEGVYQEGKLSVKRVIELQAVQAGISRDRILVSEICSICDSRCYSFRRQGQDSGRQVSFVGV